MRKRRLHWLGRVALAIGVGAAYAGVSVTWMESVHERVANAIVGGNYVGGGDFRMALSVSLAWFVPVLLIAFAVYGLLTGRGRVEDDGETRCRSCGYILRGLSEPRCPECGERI